MADQDRYYQGRNRDHGRDQGGGRDRLGQRDVYLDDRDGYGARDKGWRAEFGEGGSGRSGAREQNYNMRQPENSSFRDADYGQQDGGRFYETRDDYYRGESYGQGSGRYGRERQNSVWSYPARSNPDFYADENGAAGPGWAETWNDASGNERNRNQQGSRYMGYGRGGGYGGEYTREQEGRGRHEHHRGFFEKAADTVSSWFGGDDDGGHQPGGRESHRGKGPKGYKRSDERIREEVSDRLTDDHWLDASSIEISVQNGDVTLTGTVKSRDDKRHAERLAEQISGVDNVQNNLRVEKIGDRWQAAGGDNFGGGMTTGSMRPADAGSEDDKLSGGTSGKA